MTETLLRTEGLTKRFDELVAVDAVDFALPTGEVRGVIGPNGAGKTTFFNLVSGTLAPSAGRVVFDGEEVTGIPAHRRAKRGIAQVLQITSVFPELTVAANVLGAVNSNRRVLNPFASTDPETDADVNRVLRRVGLADEAGEKAGTLSHGDQKILEVGMALATEPDLLLLDEPTAGLSAKETEEIMALVRSLGGEVTIMLVEHDMDVIMDLVDRLTVFHRGSILVEGSPAEIQADDEVRDVYLGRDY